MIKKIISAVLAGMCILSMTACGQVKGNDSSSAIVDSKGRELKVEEPIEKIVVLHGDAYAMVKMLGFEDKIIGVSDSMVKSVEGAQDKQGVGKWNEPNVEKIIELAPDLVIGYSNYLKDENVKQMEAANITVAMFDFYNTAEVAKEVAQLGKLFDNEKKAKEYTSFINEYLDLIKERTSKISDADKATVYWEGYTDYKSAGQGTGGDELVKAAGCINLAGQETTQYPVISDEWILDNNPKLVVKAVSSTKEILGQGIKDDSAAKSVYDSLLARTGWANIDAVKNNKVMVIDSEITLSPQASIVGALYIAKLAYPEEFKDIDPAKVNDEMQSKFFNTKAEGIFVYPNNK